MNIKLFRGRRWIAKASLTVALAATTFYGLLAAAEGKLPFSHSPASIKRAQRSESATGRGYSAVVKRVVPAVVNISSSKVVKESAQDMPQGVAPSFRQFFGANFGT